MVYLHVDVLQHRNKATFYCERLEEEMKRGEKEDAAFLFFVFCFFGGNKTKPFQYVGDRFINLRASIIRAKTFVQSCTSYEQEHKEKIFPIRKKF